MPTHREHSRILADNLGRLESRSRTRPTLSTIEKYARAVGAVVEIRV